MIANAFLRRYKCLMKAFVVGLVLGCLLISPSVRADSPEDTYLNIYGLIEQGDTLSGKGDAQAARAKYYEAFKQLKQLKQDNPEWNRATVNYRMDYLKSKLAAPAAGGASATSSSAADTTPPPGINPGEPVEFKVKWQAGKQYNERIDMTIGMDLKIPGAQQQMKQVSTIGETAAVKVLKETDNGGHDLELDVQGIQAAIKMGGTTLLSFDSSKEAGSSNPLAALKKLAGAKFTTQADAAGKVGTMEGIQDLVKGMDATSAPGAGDMMKGVASEEALKEFFEQGDELPDHPVKIGDTWTKTHESMKQMGGGSLELKLTFKGWAERMGHKCAEFEYSGKVSGAASESEMGGMKIEEGRVTGTSWFDPVLGTTIESTGQMSMNVKVTAQGQTINGKMTLGMDKKVLEVTEAK